MSNRKQKISSFLDSIEREEDLSIPQFCYNTKKNSDPNKVFYGGPSFSKEELVEAIDSLLFGKWLVSGEKVAKFEKVDDKFEFIGYDEYKITYLNSNKINFLRVIVNGKLTKYKINIFGN